MDTAGSLDADGRNLLVGAPETTAAEARAGAPTTHGPPFHAVYPPGPNHQPGKIDHPDQPDRREENKIPDGAGPAVHFPRPVEVQSVPQTPVNGSTPAGGTPRPELKIHEEPAPAKESLNDSVFITGDEEPAPTPKASIPRSEPVSAPAIGNAATGSLNGQSEAAKTAAPVTHTGPAAESVPAPAPAHFPITGPVSIPDPAPTVTPQSAKPAEHAGPLKLNEPAPPPAHLGPTEPPKPDDPIAGEKRKFDSAVVAATVKPLTADRANPPPLPFDKKPKVDDAPAETNGGAPAPKAGPSRPKKDKKAPAVGRTARKTRSQGPADA